MSEHIGPSLSRRSFLGGAAAFGAVSLLSPVLAFADETEDAEAAAAAAKEATAKEKMAEADAVRQQITDMQDELAVASDNYYKALDEKNAADNAVADAQKRINEATVKIADLQDKLGTRARAMYRSGGSSFLDVILGSQSFDEFTTGWDLLSQLNDNDAEMVEETKNLRTEIEEAKIQLESEREIAKQHEEEALRIKSEAEATVVALQKLLDKLDAEAIALLEQEQAEARRRAIAADQANRIYEYTGNGKEIPANGSVVDYALSRIGCPYVWGAAGPNMFDCSGLVTWAYKQIGIDVPHQTESQYFAAVARLPVSEAEPGDVLWVGYGDGYNGHVGIALTKGGTEYVHAPTFGALVRNTDDLSWAGFTHALRFK